MGSVACLWVEAYLRSARGGRMLQGRREKALFVNWPGGEEAEQDRGGSGKSSKVMQGNAAFQKT